MKKYLCMLVACICVILGLSSCGKALDVEKDTVYVQKNSQIIGISVDKLDKGYYDSDELKKYIEERVDAFNSEHEKNSVKVDKFNPGKDKIQLHMKYADYNEYAEFNEVDFFNGMIPQALAAGYKFEQEFFAVEKGEKKAKAVVDDITESTEYKVVITEEKNDIKVDGDIVFISSNVKKVISADTVSVDKTEDGIENSLVYVVYK